MLLTPILVSTDTAVTIAFGLLSTIISLLGLLVGYLTLRAMASGTVTALRSLLLTASSSEEYQLNSNFVEKYPTPEIFESRQVHRHEHTHYVSSLGNSKHFDNASLRWRK
jgi:hypothetical protein